MLRITKKTEYAILAIEHMALNGSDNKNLSNTREIAQVYHIPYTILAKVMQKLAQKGLVKAVHGTKGGYRLAKKAVDISVADVLSVFDGPFAVAECFQATKIACPQWDECTIKDPFYELNLKINDLLASTTIADLAKKEVANKSKNWTV